MLLKDLSARVGGLSRTSKLPDHSYGFPTCKCKTGSRLCKIEDSICSRCYARKGYYVVYKNIEKAQLRRFDSLKSKTWIRDMSALLIGKGCKWFRWHDSGDLASVQHLTKIAQVAENCPDIKFWLPTKEYGMVSAYLGKHKKFPANLVVRCSACFPDCTFQASYKRTSGHIGKLPDLKELAKHVLFSEVYTFAKGYNPLTIQFPDGVVRYVCQGVRLGTCGNCRMCWNQNAKYIVYPLH